MRLQSDGTPIITTRADENVMLIFVAKLIVALEDRLPRPVKWLISSEKLAYLIEDSIKSIARR